jgi:hypothetical protein
MHLEINCSLIPQRLARNYTSLNHNLLLNSVSKGERGGERRTQTAVSRVQTIRLHEITEKQILAKSPFFLLIVELGWVEIG